MDFTIDDLNEAFEKGDYIRAIQIAEQLLKKDPDNTDVRLILGKSFMKIDNFLMAREQFETAMKKDSLNPKIYTHLGSLSFLTERDKEGLSYFKTAMEIAPDDYNYRGRFGLALMMYAIEYAPAPQKNQLTQEALDYLEEAKQNGFINKETNIAYSKYHLFKASANWTEVQNGDFLELLPTKFEHIVVAKRELDIAEKYAPKSYAPLSADLEELKNIIRKFEKRTFIGYRFVVKAGIIASIIAFLFGNVSLGVFIVIMTLLYLHSHLAPGYVEVRRELQGKLDKVPFWVKSIDNVARAADRITITGYSPGEVRFKYWALVVFVYVAQYSMAIFLMPFLIISGYYYNYSLRERASISRSSSAPIETIGNLEG